MVPERQCNTRTMLSRVHWPFHLWMANIYDVFSVVIVSLLPVRSGSKLHFDRYGKWVVFTIITVILSTLLQIFFTSHRTGLIKAAEAQPSQKTARHAFRIKGALMNEGTHLIYP